MATENLKILIDMNINLPEGDTTLSESEKCAIIDRIHHYLTDIGTTSDDYEGSLAGKYVDNDYSPELIVTEYPQTPEICLSVSDGIIQGARGNINVAVDIFDMDAKKAEGKNGKEIFAEWCIIENKLPIPVL